LLHSFSLIPIKITTHPHAVTIIYPPVTSSLPPVPATLPVTNTECQKDKSGV
jgi:hypothetical protein